jgi:hypothetical protein
VLAFVLFCSAMTIRVCLAEYLPTWRTDAMLGLGLGIGQACLMLRWSGFRFIYTLREGVCFDRCAMGQLVAWLAGGGRVLHHVLVCWHIWVAGMGGWRMEIVLMLATVGLEYVDENLYNG